MLCLEQITQKTIMKLLRLALEETHGWVGFDLDRTLAHYDEWRGIEHIGAPIPAAIALLKEHLAAGDVVKIFTARADQDDEVTCAQAAQYIEAWCEEHIGQVLPITNKKDRYMTRLYDDLARQVVPNEGTVVEAKDD